MIFSIQVLLYFVLLDHILQMAYHLYMHQLQLIQMMINNYWHDLKMEIYKILLNTSINCCWLLSPNLVLHQHVNFIFHLSDQNVIMFSLSNLIYLYFCPLMQSLHVELIFWQIYLYQYDYYQQLDLIRH